MNLGPDGRLQRNLRKGWCWIFCSWWRVCLVSVLSCIFLAVAMVLVWTNHMPYPVRHFLVRSSGIAVRVAVAGAIIMLLAAITGVLCRRYHHALTYLLGAGATLLASFFCLFGVILFDYVGPVKDYFAVNLKLPTEVELLEPKPNNPFWDFDSAPSDSFQYRVIHSIVDGHDMEDGDIGGVPVFGWFKNRKEIAEKWRKRLMSYLAANPEWRLYDDPMVGVVAMRRFRDSFGTVVPLQSDNYSNYGQTAERMNSKIGRYEYRLTMGLDGQRWQGGRGRNRVERYRGGFSYLTQSLAGDVQIEVLDRSDFPGRRMTSATMRLLMSEFSALARGKETYPDDTIVRGEPEMVISGKLGTYIANVRCNPGEPGLVYLKAYEITEDIPLSLYSLRNEANEYIGWSEDPEEQFFAQLNFVISEGDWGEYYGARFELWFKPDDSEKEERKLLERNYRIEGWMR
ncbi:MAG: hypothetical protein MJ025_02785 [Victivallaceae bacterium]|nr:hypothetical protein [Victivallaceae bacterium]